MYKYYSFKINGRIAPWKFLHVDKLEQCKEYAIDNGYDYYESIHTYDVDGNKLYCPVYFDFDGEGADKAAKEAFFKIKDLWGTYPEIYDSGNKGYHIIFPMLVEHPRCERIVYELVKLITNASSLDEGIYTNKRLFRVEGTYNSGGNRYKTKLNADYNFRLIDVNDAFFDTLLEIMSKIDSAPIYERKTEHTPSFLNVVGNMPPCLQNIFYNRPADGEKHNAVFILVNWFAKQGLSGDEVAELVLSQGFYSVEESRGIYEICRSIKSPYRIYCNSGVYGKLMRKYCIPQYCRYGEEKE